MKGLQLVVADAAAARAAMVERGLECSEIQVIAPGDGGTFFGFADPDGQHLRRDPAAEIVRSRRRAATSR